MAGVELDQIVKGGREFLELDPAFLKSLGRLRTNEDRLQSLATRGIVPNGHPIHLGQYRGMDDCGSYTVDVFVEQGVVKASSDYDGR